MGTDRERLRAAYEGTAYWVQAGPGRRFVIRCGEPSADVDDLLVAAGVETWAFITASNPRSVRLSDADNAARMEQLANTIRDRGLAHLPGAGEGGDPDWPAEPSLLVLGIAEHEAVSLARGFDQHAIVVGRRGEPARLAWIEPDGAS